MSTNQPGPGTAGKPKSDGMALLKQYGPPAVLLILLVWFVLANSQSVEVNIFFVTVSAPLVVVLIVTAVVGALIMLLVQRRGRRRA
ncbi:lipopolysaccharide assembly protein LapA domain-containing protein [Candidatus Neomicrothrix sp.]|uniref:lipopolysaccharide assembly protein LapA domain-containing protein n=1 Tax=Candidatus Neomicrothrix sp. TaxID=2719034 RepID=UPI00259666C1|nr:lipopolysaccharide assembly protein LapA domain-containing protein [Candidatus Microthrix sp.]HMS48997.1 lipopolysaccharide assembly protein LapA domain-containing protein [Candidatus Microthrix sp.]